MKSVLDSRQLLAARVLASTGSFTLTGQQLSLTQSAVSHAIKALEEEVECRLFHRGGKGVTVTPAGKHFLEYTDEILAQMETARTLVSPRTTRGKERLRLGVSARARQFILPVVLPIFKREYANKLVAIEPGDYARNLELLESGLLDLVFTVKPPGRSQSGYVHLFDDELRFFVGPGHPWSRTGRASREDLAGRTLMLHLKVNNTPELLADYFRNERVTPRHGVEMADHESLKAVLKTNLAVGVLPPWLAEKELADGSLVTVPMGSKPLIRQWGLAYDAKRQLTAMDRRFIELCQQSVPGILSRLQGQATPAPQKKEQPVEPALAEARMQYSGVAMLLATVYSLLSDSIAWVDLGSIAIAVS
jgi:DNA-binding transcriptional LysR family regulator